MSEFKVGDRVKCVEEDDWGSLTLGNFYTVTKVSEKACTVTMARLDGWWNMRRFELVRPSFEGIKKGDKIRIVLETEAKFDAYVDYGAGSLDTEHNWFREGQGDIVSVEVIEKAKPALPTEAGTTFKAKVDGVESTWFVRKMVSGKIQYIPEKQEVGAFYQSDIDNGLLTVELP